MSRSHSIRAACQLIALASTAAWYACSSAAADMPVLDAAITPLHLEEHLAAAQVTGSELPAEKRWDRLA